MFQSLHEDLQWYKQWCLDGTFFLRESSVKEEINVCQHSNNFFVFSIKALCDIRAKITVTAIFNEGYKK